MMDSQSQSYLVGHSHGHGNGGGEEIMLTSYPSSSSTISSSPHIRSAGLGSAPDDEPLLLAGENIRSRSRSRSRSNRLKRGGGGSCWQRCWCCSRNRTFEERDLLFAPSRSSYCVTSNPPLSHYPSNVVNNQKYNLLTFFPLFLYEQFKFFFNLYFLLVAISQFIPVLQVGFLFTYIAPLAFVLSVTMLKEAYDDIKRFQRDREVNSTRYSKLGPNNTVETITAASIKVGDLLLLSSNTRVPADLILLRTHDKSGSIFIRTDQLDGETDWKLRNPVPSCQKLPNDVDLFHLHARLSVEAPHKEIYAFAGTFQQLADPQAIDKNNNIDLPIESLSLENTLWQNTVIASGTSVGVVIYTGAETRANLNANSVVNKIGLLDLEINRLSKILFCLTILLAGVITILKGIHGKWYIYFFRFVLLFSSIIPISMRVNLDLGKTLYSIFIMTDKSIPGTIVRNSTIPEELGRISYLFSDKTGTLTKNVMSFKVLQLEPPVVFNKKSLPHLITYLKAGYAAKELLLKDKDEKSSPVDFSPLSVPATANPTDGGGIASSPPSRSASSDSSSGLLSSSPHPQQRRATGRSSSGRAHPSDAGDHYSLQDDDFELEERKSSHNLNNSAFEDEDEDPHPKLKSRKASDKGMHSRIEINMASDDMMDSAPNSASKILKDEATAIKERQEELARIDNELDLELQAHDINELSHSMGISKEKITFKVKEMINALALCHNVTPVREEDGSISFNAASPDEIALVKFADSIGLKLADRTQQAITLVTPMGDTLVYDVLNIFLFTSETKRMGIIVRSRESGQILFYLKGADVVMKSKILSSDLYWLDEEVDNLARIGLRTLVFAVKPLSSAEFKDFSRRYNQAKAVIKDRDAQVLNVVATLEKNLTLLGLTGVEDALQAHVRSTLETLRNAGLKIWMLTGDKAETAQCIGISARLIDRNQSIYSMTNVTTQREAARQLDLYSTKNNCCLVIDGVSLAICLDNFQSLFLELTSHAPSVICCRCSPTQKAQVVELMKTYSNKRVAAIGDGGNDVSMILAANVGIGIVGKEGKQASLAADFSINQFSFITQLLLWHGRNSYSRSSRLSQFIIHRGLIISIIQAVFSALFFYVAIPIYNGWLQVGYATFYTMMPVFSLVLDEDVEQNKVFLYPELYNELQKNKPLSLKTFFIWIFRSVYQGGIIMILAIVLFENKFLNIVAITFTSLVLSELLNVALEIHKWHYLMVIAQVASVIIYFVSLLFLKSYFDIAFILTSNFWWKVAVITSVSCLPPSLIKCIYDRYSPSAQYKLQH